MCFACVSCSILKLQGPKVESQLRYSRGSWNIERWSVCTSNLILFLAGWWFEHKLLPLLESDNNDDDKLIMMKVVIIFSVRIPPLVYSEISFAWLFLFVLHVTYYNINYLPKNPVGGIDWITLNSGFLAPLIVIADKMYNASDEERDSSLRDCAGMFMRYSSNIPYIPWGDVVKTKPVSDEH